MDICDHRVGIRNYRVGIGDDCMSISNHCVCVNDHRVSVCNHDVGIDRQLGLKGELLNRRTPNKTNRAHIEHVKNPDKVLLPTRNLVPIPLRMDKPGEWIPVTLFDHPSLDLGYGPADDQGILAY